MMIYTSLQAYLYPLIQRKSIPQTSLVITLTHTRTHTRNCKSLYYIHVPITDTTLELSVFWPSDTETEVF